MKFHSVNYNIILFCYLISSFYYCIEMIYLFFAIWYAIKGDTRFLIEFGCIHLIWSIYIVDTLYAAIKKSLIFFYRCLSCFILLYIILFILTLLRSTTAFDKMEIVLRLSLIYTASKVTMKTPLSSSILPKKIIIITTVINRFDSFVLII